MFLPKIIGFICNWSLPKGIEKPSRQKIKSHPKVHILRVMCIGRIDPVLVLETFANGADGVFLVGCPKHDCHYVEGHTQTEYKVKVLKKLISLSGLEPDRLRLEWALPTEVEFFSAIVDNFRNQIINLGQSPLAGESPDKHILLNVLAARNAAAEFRVRVLTGREEELTKFGNVYRELIQHGEFDDLADKIIRAEFLKHRILLLTSEKPLSIKEIAGHMDVNPDVILRLIVDMRRKGSIALDQVKETTPLYRALEVQRDN